MEEDINSIPTSISSWDAKFVQALPPELQTMICNYLKNPDDIINYYQEILRQSITLYNFFNFKIMTCTLWASKKLYTYDLYKLYFQITSILHNEYVKCHFISFMNNPIKKCAVTLYKDLLNKVVDKTAFGCVVHSDPYSNMSIFYCASVDDRLRQSRPNFYFKIYNSNNELYATLKLNKSDFEKNLILSNLIVRVNKNFNIISVNSLDKCLLFRKKTLSDKTEFIRSWNFEKTVYCKNVLFINRYFIIFSVHNDLSITEHQDSVMIIFYLSPETDEMIRIDNGSLKAFAIAYQEKSQSLTFLQSNNVHSQTLFPNGSFISYFSENKLTAIKFFYETERFSDFILKIDDLIVYTEFYRLSHEKLLKSNINKLKITKLLDNVYVKKYFEQKKCLLSFKNRFTWQIENNSLLSYTSVFTHTTDKRRKNCTLTSFYRKHDLLLMHDPYSNTIILYIIRFDKISGNTIFNSYTLSF